MLVGLTQKAILRICKIFIWQLLKGKNISLWSKKTFATGIFRFLARFSSPIQENLFSGNKVSQFFSLIIEVGVLIQTKEYWLLFWLWRWRSFLKFLFWDLLIKTALNPNLCSEEREVKISKPLLFIPAYHFITFSSYSLGDIHA